MPTRAEATTLYSARGSAEPWAYLHAQGIYTVTDNQKNILGVPTFGVYWTAEACPASLPCAYDLHTGATGTQVFCNDPFQATVDASCKSVNSVSDGSLAIAVRNPTPAETYRSICDANGQNCAVSCGPADDPNSEICPVP